jgi:hypothetical protein
LRDVTQAPRRQFGQRRVAVRGELCARTCDPRGCFIACGQGRVGLVKLQADYVAQQPLRVAGQGRHVRVEWRQWGRKSGDPRCGLLVGTPRQFGSLRRGLRPVNAYGQTGTAERDQDEQRTAPQRLDDRRERAQRVAWAVGFRSFHRRGSLRSRGRA